MAETQRRVTRDGTLPVQYPRDAVGRDADAAAQFRGAHAKFRELLGEMFAGVGWSACHDGFPQW